MYSLVSRVEDKNHHGLAASQTHLPSEYNPMNVKISALGCSAQWTSRLLGRLVAPAIISCDFTIC